MTIIGIKLEAVLLLQNKKRLLRRPMGLCTGVETRTSSMVPANILLHQHLQGILLFINIPPLEWSTCQCHSIPIWLGVKRVTEPNRTEPTDYTGRSLRKFPIAAVPGFTSVTEPNQQMRYLLSILLLFLLVIKLITQVSRFLFRDASNLQYLFE